MAHRADPRRTVVAVAEVARGFEPLDEDDEAEQDADRVETLRLVGERTDRDRSRRDLRPQRPGERGDERGDHRQLEPDRAKLDMFEPAQTAEIAERAEQREDRGRHPVRNHRIDDAERLECEIGEQVEIISDRDEIGEDQRKIGGAVEPEQHRRRRFGREHRFEATDIVAHRKTEEIGNGAERRHRRDRIMARDMAKDRPRDEEARPDDRRERRDGRAPVARTQQRRRQHHRRGRDRDDEQDEVGRTHRPPKSCRPARSSMISSLPPPIALTRTSR